MFAHDKGGALGLVVNKPLGVTPINEIVKVPENFSDKQKNLLKKKIPVFWGGPVNKNKVFILHTNEYADKSTINIRNLSIQFMKYYKYAMYLSLALILILEYLEAKLAITSLAFILVLVPEPV